MHPEGIIFVLYMIIVSNLRILNVLKTEYFLGIFLAKMAQNLQKHTELTLAGVYIHGQSHLRVCPWQKQRNKTKNKTKTNKQTDNRPLK